MTDVASLGKSVFEQRSVRARNCCTAGGGRAWRGDAGGDGDGRRRIAASHTGPGETPRSCTQTSCSISGALRAPIVGSEQRFYKPHSHTFPCASSVAHTGQEANHIRYCRVGRSWHERAHSRETELASGDHCRENDILNQERARLALFAELL